MALENALFTYLISKKQCSRFSNSIYLPEVECYINYTNKTEVQYQRLGNKVIVIIGVCIDAYGEIPHNKVVEELICTSGNVLDVYRKCDRLAGKYVIIYFDGENGYIWGDATSSLPINYGFDDGDEFFAASTDKIAADYMGCLISNKSLKIRRGSLLEQALPGDMTMYDEIKALLPNHYLSLKDKCPIRISLRLCNYRGIDEIIATSIKLIDNITKEYADCYDLICPLTAGADSRVVYSFIKKIRPEVQCYTFYHKGFNDETDDLYVPGLICENYSQPYKQIKDVDALDDEVNEVASLVGNYIDKETVSLAKTYNMFFDGKTLINGNIIDQIGKSLIGNNVPVYMARSSFFMCKLHNFEKETISELEQYMYGIVKAGDIENIFDLFAMENRCGRWATQADVIYSVCGIRSLNIFNCRELIMMWISMPRGIRKKLLIHKNILSKNDDKLLSYPFNPHDKLIRLVKNNWLWFYCATYLKYGVSYFKRYINLKFCLKQ